MLLQNYSPALRTLATAHLAQTMSLLSLTAGELRQKIDAALASNPALELVENRHCPTCRRPLMNGSPCPVCGRPATTGQEPVVFLSPRDDIFAPRSSAAPSNEPFTDDDLGAETESLPQYVLRQIAADLRPEDRPLAAHILTSLDEDGLLNVSIAEISRYHHVPPSRVEAVLRLIQHADPLGVGSPSPQDALLIQLEVLAESRMVPPLAAEAVRQGMELLSRRKYAELGALLGIRTEAARTVAQFITENLNPFPARAHWGDQHCGEEAAPEAFHAPDVIITTLSSDEKSPLVVEVIVPYAGTLRLNPLFREAIHQAPTEKAEQWQNDLEQATLLVKCLQQRNQAIVRLMQQLVGLQREFILHGEAHIRPITRARLARQLDVHESTISRAVASKAVQLPNGHIIPLAKFFDRSLHVRTALKQIIAQSGATLSDSEIAKVLQRQGYTIARRTVAKYRAMEGILPSHLRQLG